VAGGASAGYCHAMRSFVLTFLVLLAAPVAAQAPVDSSKRPPRYLFITPMGEPLRGDKDGEALVDTWFAGADVDGDGSLRRAEFRKDAARVFKAFDADGDGRIGTAEIAAWETRMVPEINGGFFGPPGDWGGAKDHGAIAGSGTGDAKAPAYTSLRLGASRWSILNIPQPVAGADIDLDRSITAQEWTAAADRRFRMLDEADDGALARRDLPRYSPRRR
jgi:EF hand